MIAVDFTGLTLKLKRDAGKIYVFDPLRKKWLVLTPEEQVRQYLLQYMIEVLQYPQGMIAVEKKIMVGAMTKRFDIVVYDRSHQPWLLAECKAPEVLITEAALHQLLAYQRTTRCKYWVLSNGHQHFCADAADLQQIRWVGSLPSYEL
ncbi:type I restriction enzyme HsdR N-terminal domain-containing protein [Chitinophagaceae bacterium MMS25-I14]